MTGPSGGGGTVFSLFPRSPGHSWPSDPFMASGKNPDTCVVLLFPQNLLPLSQHRHICVVTQMHTSWLLPSCAAHGQGHSHLGCPPACAQVHLHAFSRASPAHTIEHGLLNALEVAHPSTPVNKHVHRHFGPHSCACIPEGVPWALGWSVWFRPASWHSQTSGPA